MLVAVVADGVVAGVDQLLQQIFVDVMLRRLQIARERAEHLEQVTESLLVWVAIRINVAHCLSFDFVCALKKPARRRRDSVRSAA